MAKSAFWMVKRRHFIPRDLGMREIADLTDRPVLPI
jgi:hypothetical protein